jgi:hypothetical protein
LSGATAGTWISGPLTIRSGLPSSQPSSPIGSALTGGRSATLPSGAPLSTQRAMVSICSWLSEMSPL